MKRLTPRLAMVLSYVLVLAVGLALAFPLVYLTGLLGAKIPLLVAMFLTTLASGLALEGWAHRILLKYASAPQPEVDFPQETLPELPPATVAINNAMVTLLGRRIIVDGVPYLHPPEASVATLRFKNATFQLRVIVPEGSPAYLGPEGKEYVAAVDEDFELYITRTAQ